MRMLLLLLFVSPAVAGPYVGLGVGKNGLLQDDWEARDHTGCMLEVGYLWRPYSGYTIDARYSHFSQCSQGWPYNENLESTLDSGGLWLRYEWK